MWKVSAERLSSEEVRSLANNIRPYLGRMLWFRKSNFDLEPPDLWKPVMIVDVEHGVGRVQVVFFFEGAKDVVHISSNAEFHSWFKLDDPNL